MTIKKFCGLNVFGKIILSTLRLIAIDRWFSFSIIPLQSSRCQPNGNFDTAQCIEQVIKHLMPQTSLLLKFFIINSNFVSCKIVRKKSFYDCFLFQTKLGDYQAGYTDDQCFCYDEVKSWFFLQFLLNQVFFESSELAKAWRLRLNDRPPQYGRLCARMPQGGRGRSFKVTEKDATVRR